MPGRSGNTQLDHEQRTRDLLGRFFEAASGLVGYDPFTDGRYLSPLPAWAWLARPELGQLADLSRRALYVLSCARRDGD